MDGFAHTPLARRQDSLLTTAQLHDLGWSQDQIDAALRRRWLHPVHKGVHSLTPVLTRRARWRAATLATGAPLGHRSACALSGLLRSDGPRVEVVTQRGLRDQEGIRVRRTRDLPDADLTRRHGIPTTTPTRSVLDLCAGADRDLALEAAMQALHLGVLDTARVLAFDLKGRRGAATVRALQERLREQTRTELETAMLGLCLRGGLPRPRCQHPIGRLHVDFAWPEHRLAVETDGWETHRTRAAFEDDRARDAWLATQGWTVLRFTWRQVTEQPGLVLSALRVALAQ